MTKEEFIEYWYNNTDADPETKARRKKSMIAVECNCGEKICKGWAMIPNNETMIELYDKLHGRSSKNI